MPAQTLTERLFDDADTAPIDPFAVFEEWFAARPRERAQRPPRHGPRDRRCRPACPTSAWCCSTPATTAASASSPISRAPRARQLLADPARPPSASTGSRSAARSACAARSRSSPTPRPTPISRPAPRGSPDRRPRQPARPGRSRAAPSSPTASRRSTRASATDPVTRPAHWSGFRLVPLADRVLEGRRLPPPRPHAVHPRYARRRRGRASRLYP